MDTIFNWCVDFLIRLAKLTGMTYNEINIWIFVIIEPIVFFIMLWIIINQKKRIGVLRKQIAGQQL